MQNILTVIHVCFIITIHILHLQLDKYYFDQIESQPNILAIVSVKSSTFLQIQLQKDCNYSENNRPNCNTTMF